MCVLAGNYIVRTGSGLDMSGFFWVASITMASIAFAFVGLPLLTSGKRISILVTAIAVPLFAGGLYWTLGTPAAAGKIPLSGEATPTTRNSSSKSAEQVGSVASMVEGLAARLEMNPEDGASWLLLAKSYKHLGQIPDAIAAYARAAALGKTDPDLAALSGIQIPINQ